MDSLRALLLTLLSAVGHGSGDRQLLLCAHEVIGEQDVAGAKHVPQFAQYSQCVCGAAFGLNLAALALWATHGPTAVAFLFAGMLGIAFGA